MLKQELVQQEIKKGFDSAHALTGIDFDEYTGRLSEDSFEARMDSTYIYVKHKSCGVISRYFADAITPRWIKKYQDQHSESCVSTGGN